MYGQKTAVWLIFCKLEMELLKVDMGIYHLKMHFKVVRYQMSHYYLHSKSKTEIKKWYFDYFIADYFLSLFYEHPVYFEYQVIILSGTISNRDKAFFLPPEIHLAPLEFIKFCVKRHRVGGLQSISSCHLNWYLCGWWCCCTNYDGSVCV